jgi:hypothetical protein
MILTVIFQLLDYKKSTLTCAVSYFYNLQDTLTISNSKGETYHKSYGYVYSEGDVFSREIDKTLEFARALSKGSSVSISKSDGYSAAIENVQYYSEYKFTIWN